MLTWRSLARPSANSNPFAGDFAQGAYRPGAQEGLNPASERMCFSDSGTAVIAGLKQGFAISLTQFFQ